MNLRKRKHVDYRRLNGGEPPQDKELRTKAISWSTKRLYRLQIEEERVNANTGEKEVRVHYPGWDRRIDEWRSTGDIVAIGKQFTDSNAHDLLRITVSIQLKEALNGARLQNPEVTLHIPVQLDTFKQFIELIEPVEAVQKGMRTVYRLTSYTQASAYFENDWWYRVLNVYGDCCHIVPGTLTTWMFERQPLTEFSLTDLSPKQIYRGYVLVVRFVRDTKSRDEMLNVIEEVNRSL